MASCIIFLSDKSSGSSAIQREFAAVDEINMVKWTSSAQNETLFWIYAAAILGLPQDEIIYSRLPISKESASTRLNQLLEMNGSNLKPDNFNSDEEWIFASWKELCALNAPIFFEKSPHHLLNWSSLELIVKFISKHSEVDVRIVGGVRNPMDTIYSHWTRWRVDPQKKQYEWKRAYENLLKLKQIIPDNVIIVKYEDLVADVTTMDKLLSFVGAKRKSGVTSLHSKSVKKWRSDRLFGFQLDDSVSDFAEVLGYTEDELINSRNIAWPVYRLLARRSHRYMMIRKRIIQTLRRLRNWLFR